ncbi:unnamed protein product [Rhizopus stolonifer]
MIPITSHIQYPWNPRPLAVDDNLEKNLRESHERERYLERIIHSQTNQLNEPSVKNTINTLENIYLCNQNELKIQHSNEVDKLKNELDVLSRKKDKLDVITNHLNSIELMDEGDDDSFKEERKTLLRKLKLNELRLAVKDIELAALEDKQNDQPHPLTNLSLLADKLLQDQYPKKRAIDDKDSQLDSKRSKWENKSWSKKQDELLLEATQKIGTNDWQRISRIFPQYTPLECFERWEMISNNPRRLPSISALLD